MSVPDQWRVEIRTLPPRRVAAVRHRGPYPMIGDAFQRVVAWAKSQNLLQPGAEIIGIFHDDPERIPVDRLRSEACVTVPQAAHVDGDVQMLTIEGGPYAVVTHRGPHSDLQPVYRRLYGEWMEAAGRRPRPLPSFEIYLNDPADMPPEDLVTEVCIPIL